MGAAFGVRAALVGYGAASALARTCCLDVMDAIALVISAASGAVAAKDAAAG
jgi:hypothetical protein